MKADEREHENDRWHVALDPWVREQTLRLLRLAAGEWQRREGPVGRTSEGGTPAPSSHRPWAPISLSSRSGRLTVAGTLDLPDGEWTVEVAETADLEPNAVSTCSHEAVASRVAAWTQRLLGGRRQPAFEVRGAETALRRLLEGAAHASLASWDYLIVEPNHGATPPTIFDPDAVPGDPQAWIECVPNAVLRRALLQARDPFVHVTQRLTTRRIEVAMGGAPTIVLQNARDPLQALRAAACVPPGARLDRVVHDA